MDKWPSLAWHILENIIQAWPGQVSLQKNYVIFKKGQLKFVSSVLVFTMRYNIAFVQVDQCSIILLSL